MKNYLLSIITFSLIALSSLVNAHDCTSDPAYNDPSECCKVHKGATGC